MRPMLKVHSIHEGFCRIYFRETGSKKLFCIQENTPKSVEFLECSQDGEPSHAVDACRYILQYPNPLVHGKSKLMDLCWAFIDKNNLENEKEQKS
mgnify:CR=1 FL=1